MIGGVVAVVAHPDDESLIAGGTLALAAQAGAATGVVSLTRGEQGPISDSRLAAPSTLGDVREAELQAAARALGVDWAACLREPDGELSWIDQRATADALAVLLAPAPPGIVLTFGDDGVYGHPDHAAARDIAVLALKQLGSPYALYEAAWPAGAMTALAAAARERGLPTGLWGLAPEDFGCGREPTLVLGVRPVLARKLAALRAHRTQVGADHLLAALPDDLAELHLGHEGWAGPPAGPLEELLGRG
jgi:N-acetyl-1-D-myo-inositol-2-amino-2-deoxy-alpha-D-glucopyranoside deacetylase